MSALTAETIDIAVEAGIDEVQAARFEAIALLIDTTVEQIPDGKAREVTLLAKDLKRYLDEAQLPEQLIQRLRNQLAARLYKALTNGDDNHRWHTFADTRHHSHWVEAFGHLGAARLITVESGEIFDHQQLISSYNQVFVEGIPCQRPSWYRGTEPRSVIAELPPVILTGQPGEISLHRCQLVTTADSKTFVRRVGSKRSEIHNANISVGPITAITSIDTSAAHYVTGAHDEQSNTVILGVNRLPISQG